MMAFPLDGGGFPIETDEAILHREVKNLIDALPAEPLPIFQNAPLPQLISFANILLGKFMDEQMVSPEIRRAVAAFKHEKEQAERNAGQLRVELEKITFVIRGAVEIMLKPDVKQEIKDLAHAQQEQYVSKRSIFIAWKARALAASKFFEQLEFIVRAGGFEVLNAEFIERDAELESPLAFGNLMLEPY